VAEALRTRHSGRAHAGRRASGRSVLAGTPPTNETLAARPTDGTGWPGGAPRHNLPPQPNPIIGRDRDLAVARQQLVRADVRLLTLTGPPGVGKTRLAIDVAAGVVDDFADGVWFVDLSSITDARLVMDAISRQLGLRDFGRRAPAELLEEYLRDRALLLVLDNVEQVLDAASDVGELLAACPRLKVLATSRAPLRLRWESELPLPPLRLPTLDGSSAVDAVTASPAGRLFLERARTVAPRFVLVDADAAAVAEICARLDGLPLAIELAAARTKLFPPRALLRRLVVAEDAGGREPFLLRLLAGDTRDLPPRQQTLLRAINWSYDLLDQRERRLFQRLSVFVGGCTLEAAEAVGMFDGGGGLDVITSLVDKSLVSQDEQADGEPRLRMLETIRAYARAELGASGDADDTLARHAEHYVDLAERAAPQFAGPDQQAWFGRLERERGNLLAIEGWAVGSGNADITLRLVAALWPFWLSHGDAAEAGDRLRPVLPLVGRVPDSSLLARALHGAGVLAEKLGDYKLCRSLLEASLAVARRIDDADAQATALDSLGRQEFVEGHYAEARVLLEESHAILSRLNDRVGLARVLSHAGFLEHLEGRPEEARAVFLRGLAIAREVDDRHRIAEFMDNLGNTFEAQGDFDSAARMFAEAVAMWRALRQVPWLAMALYNLGEAELGRGELHLARRYLSESISLSRRLGDRRRLAYALSAVARLAAAKGEPERAARFEAVARMAAAAIGARSQRRPSARGALPVHIAARAAQLQAAVATVQAPPLEQTADECLAWLARPQLAPATDRRAAPSTPPEMARHRVEGLTPRERDVVGLLTRGLTNRQIASELVVTEGTAENYVQRVLGKLGFNNRTQVAAWALERGLHQAIA
jgi:predicted ATPase/DNA-binding CsgD family transcriptional regulator